MWYNRFSKFSFWGERSWDLFSLLEDSRMLFTDQYNHLFY